MILSVCKIKRANKSYRGKTAELVGAQVSAKTLINKTTLGLVATPATGMMIHRAGIVKLK